MEKMKVERDRGENKEIQGKISSCITKSKKEDVKRRRLRWERIF